MAETRISVPLEGSSVVSQGDVSSQAQPGVQQRASAFQNGQYVPPTERQSLHKTRLGQTLAARQAEQPVETVPVWQDHPGGQGGRFEYRQVARQAETTQATAPPQSTPANDAMSQQLGVLTDVVKLMAQQQGLIPEDTGPTMPNPAYFDFYDAEDESRYHAELESYVQQRLQSAIEPIRPALQSLQNNQEMNAQFNELMAQHGDNPDFRAVMKSALEMVADSNSAISIKDAFAYADRRDNKPGERGGRLPKALTKGKLPRFGAILLHNQLSGRSRR
jgi:hypothetical protein